jgi:hypothetical protein
MRMKSLLLLSLVTLLPQPVDASCMRAEFIPALLTRRETKLPGDGGVLVGFGFSTKSEDFEQTGTDPSDVKWTARDRKHPIALTRTALAPGLSVYRPADGVTDFTIANAKGKQLGAFTHDDKAPVVALAAPKPRSLVVKRQPSLRSTTTDATLELTAAPPPEAVAVILYTNAKAVSFASLPDTHDKLTSLDVFHSGGHCSNDVPGTGGVTGGLQVTFAYVDAFGRLSPQSTAVTAK